MVETPTPVWSQNRRSCVRRSGGTELGRRVADKLELGFFAIAIVEQMGRELGIHRPLVASLDKHLRSVIDRYVTGMEEGS